jgi:hypothetical protein
MIPDDTVSSSCLKLSPEGNHVVGEQALIGWAEKPAKCISPRSQIVLELCEANGIERVVIDSKLRTMIVLQKGE